MKARPQSAPLRKASAPRADGGFASVVVLILTFVMIALLLGNTRVLEALKRDLQRVEQRQLARPVSEASTLDARPPPAATAPASPAAGTPDEVAPSLPVPADLPSRGAALPGRSNPAPSEPWPAH